MYAEFWASADENLDQEFQAESLPEFWLLNFLRSQKVQSQTVRAWQTVTQRLPHQVTFRVPVDTSYLDTEQPDLACGGGPQWRTAAWWRVSGQGIIAWAALALGRVMTL